jgi:hypothetical protein
MSPTPAEIAEDLMAHLPPVPGLERERNELGVLTFVPGSTPFFANVAEVRAGDERGLHSLAARAAGWFAERGRHDCFWFLSPATTPGNAIEVLESMGLARVGNGTAMTMTSPPPPGAEGVEIREVTDPRALLTYRLLTLEAGSTDPVSDSDRASAVAENDRAWVDHLATNGRRRCFLAYVDGEPVAAGGLLFTDLGAAVLAGGATAPSARGRGLYRSLVRYRWDVAVEAGVDALVVQASDHSRPILTGLGFDTVAELSLVRQEFAAAR